MANYCENLVNTGNLAWPCCCDSRLVKIGIQGTVPIKKKKFLSKIRSDVLWDIIFEDLSSATEDLTFKKLIWHKMKLKVETTTNRVFCKPIYCQVCNDINNLFFDNNFMCCNIFYYLPPAGDINLHHVCACVRAWVRVCVRAWVRACVTQFSLRLLQLDIFCQRKVLMNFHALEYFFGFIHFELKLSE